MTPQSDRKFQSLESLRGVAALLVVAHHIPRWNPAFDTSLVRNSYLMVEFFFVLSGFVIYSAYAGKIQTLRQLASFQFLRLGRLYPVHLVFLVAFVALEVLKLFAQNKLQIVNPNAPPIEGFNYWALIQQLFLAQAVGPTGNSATFNSPAWSISVEFYTYLVFGMTVLLFGKAARNIFLALAVAALLLLHFDPANDYRQLMRCFGGFFLGCQVARWAPSAQQGISPALSSVALGGIGLFLVYRTRSDQDILIYLLTAILILGLTAAKPGRLEKILLKKPLVWLGERSYSIYMCHFLIIWGTNQVFRVLLKIPEKLVDGRSTPSLECAATFASWLLVISLVLILGNIVYLFIEQPFRRRSRAVVYGTVADGSGKA